MLSSFLADENEMNKERHSNGGALKLRTRSVALPVADYILNVFTLYLPWYGNLYVDVG